jgi:hypothetical protein
MHSNPTQKTKPNQNKTKRKKEEESFPLFIPQGEQHEERKQHQQQQQQQITELLQQPTIIKPWSFFLINHFSNLVNLGSQT